MSEDVKRWLEIAKYDLVTAEAMYASGRYLYVLFCCQQAIEKLLKARIVEKTREFPPRTHDLMKLSQSVALSLTEEQDGFLRRLTKYYIGTRYPEEISLLAQETTGSIANQYLQKTKEFTQWLEAQSK